MHRARHEHRASPQQAQMQAQPAEQQPRRAPGDASTEAIATGDATSALGDGRKTTNSHCRTLPGSPTTTDDQAAADDGLKASGRTSARIDCAAAARTTATNSTLLVVAPLRQVPIAFVSVPVTSLKLQQHLPRRTAAALTACDRTAKSHCRYLSSC